MLYVHIFSSLRNNLGRKIALVGNQLSKQTNKQTNDFNFTLSSEHWILQPIFILYKFNRRKWFWNMLEVLVVLAIFEDNLIWNSYDSYIYTTLKWK